MSTNKTPDQLLMQAVRDRRSTRQEFQYGINTADEYVRTLQDRVGLDLCYKWFSSRTVSFNDVVQKAAGKLVYSNTDTKADEDQNQSQLRQQLRKLDIVLPKNTLLVFRHILTTPRKDRDGDTLRTEGAVLDMKMLLLWQHVHTLPIGKMLGVATHNEKRLELYSCVVDMNELAHDSAVMIDNGMGRFSHGFRALEFDRHKGEDGFDVKRFEVIEESLVSVPSNIDAETEEVLLSLVGKGKLRSDVIKQVAQSVNSTRNVSHGGGVTYRERFGEYQRSIRGAKQDVLELAKQLNGEDTNGQSTIGQPTIQTGTTAKGQHASTPEKTDGAGGAGKEGPGQADQNNKTQNAQVTITKGAGGYLENSWEDIEWTLRDMLHRFLIGAGISNEMDSSWIVGTFSDHVIACVHRPNNGTECFRIGWQMVDGKPKLVGEAQPVDIVVTTEIVDRASFLRSINKAGRTLSKANEERIRSARDGIEEVRSMDIVRAAKALLKEASEDLKTVLSGMEDDSDETSTQADAVKRVIDLAIAGQEEESINKLFRILKAIETAKQTNSVVDQYLSFTGSKST